MACTSFMCFDDRVLLQAKYNDGQGGLFGVIHQRVVQAPAPRA
jgi:hypothetical protein